MNILQGIMLALYQGPMGPVEMDTFIKSLGLMGKGMLGIFVVMALIWLVIFCLNKFTSEKQTN